MSSLHFTKTELAAAISRGVRQCVVIGWPQPLREILASSPDETLQVFALDEQERSPDTLAAALEKSGFDKLKASLFVWLGDAGYRTVDAAICTLAFIASLPKGSGVVLDYTVERSSLGSLTHTALDALASRISEAGGSVKYLIQPQAVETMLRSLGFEQIVDLAAGSGGRLVSAVV
jgi:O-methyltransferase involved in polyketide biosynthesis